MNVPVMLPRPESLSCATWNTVFHIADSPNAKILHKRYAALLEGDVAEGSGSVALPLALNVFDRPRQCVLPVAAGGSEALTRF